MLRRLLMTATILYMLLLVARMPAQSIYWASETVAANNVGTVNTFADPYGIQAVFDVVATANDIFRIVKGANNYDSTTASWGGRDDATHDINVDVAHTGGNKVRVQCWDDEATQNTGVGACLLDFSTGTGLGIDVNQGAYFFQNIGVTGAATNGWTLDTFGGILYQCLSSSNGANGFVGGNANYIFIESVGHSNTADGFVLGNTNLAYRVEAYGNGGDGVQLGTDAYAIGVLTYGNTQSGVQMIDAFNFTAQVTAYGNTQNGVSAFGGTSDYMVVTDSLLTNNTQYNFATNGGSIVFMLENTLTRAGGAGEILLNGELLLQENVQAPTAAAVTYVNAAGFDFQPNSGNVGLTIPYPRGTTTSTPQAGTVQETGTGTAGATAYAH